MLIRSISSTNDELQNMYVYMDTDYNIESNFVFQNLPKSTETDIDWGQTRLQTESEAVRTLMLRNIHNYSNNTVFEYALERAKAVICSDAVTPAALKEAITWHYLAGVERIIQAAPELLACNVFMWDTPLTWAVFCADDTHSSLTESSLDVIKLLLAANADINFRLETPHGNETALSRAIEKMNVDVLLFLLNQGADVTKIDKYGLSQKQKGNLIDYLFAEYRFIHGMLILGIHSIKFNL